MVGIMRTSESSSTHTHQKSGFRDFFLYLIAIITLYMSVGGLIGLCFQYVNHLFPDTINVYSQGADMDIARTMMAMLFVAFPIYLGITWFLRKDVIQNPEHKSGSARKFFVYLTIFLAALTMIIDLVTLVYNFLNGELTTRFVLKVLSVLLVSGAVFAYYLWDIRRKEHEHARPSKVLAAAASIIVIAAIVMGFVLFGSPHTQRLRRFDERRVNDLSWIQQEVTNYWQINKKLPQNLELLNNDLTGFHLSVDPQTAKNYEYIISGQLNFQLCAEFGIKGDDYGVQYGPYRAGKAVDSWHHEAGRVCFDRKIDPTLMQPMPTPKF